MMTRKNYEATAEIVSRISNPNTREMVALDFSAMFAADNDRFDRIIFLTACNVA